MSVTLLDPPTSAEVGLITKSTLYRVQFAVEGDAAGGPLVISAVSFAGSTPVKSLVGSQPFRALPLLSLFQEVAGTAQATAAIMQDVQVTSRTIATSDAAASAVPPCGYDWLGDVGGQLFPFLYIVAPATSAGGLWAVTIELRQSLIG